MSAPRWLVCLVCVGIVGGWLSDHVATAADEPGPQTPADSIFPDKNLEAAVRAEVFGKRGTDQPLTATDVAKISRVVGKNRGIVSLEGLQHCESLMLIDFSGNKIVDLQPIAGLKRLQSVTLAHNRIATLEPIGELTAVQLLDVSGNAVESLHPLAKMANLRTLAFASNRVPTLQPIADLTKIWSLDCSGNPVADLAPVAKWRWLTMIDAAGCRVTSLDPLSPLVDLDMLILSGNPIATLDPLVQMCLRDTAGDRRFAPYLDVYFSPEQLANPNWVASLQSLREAGVRIHPYQRPALFQIPG